MTIQSSTEQVLIFAYGTLRDPEVQKTLTGRVIEGSPDVLIGYSRYVYDGYPIIFPDAGQRLEGVVITIESTELDAFDFYEGAAYDRIKVALESGREAWVYRGKPHLEATVTTVIEK